MGLLDNNFLGGSFDDPKTQAVFSMAAGLLGGGNLGQALGRGLGGYQDVMRYNKAQKLQDEMMDYKRQEMQADIDAKNLRAKALSNLPGLGGSSGGVGGSSGGLADMSLDNVTSLGAILGKDLLPAWKMAREGIRQDAGQWYINPQTNQREYIPDPTKGVGVSGNQVVGLPGFNAANAEMKGTESEAVERAKAGFDPVKIYDPGQGREVYTTRAEVAQGGNQVPQIPQGWAGISPQQRKLIMADMANNPNPNPTIAQNWDYGQPQQAQRFAAGPSAAESASNAAAEVSAKDTASANVQRDSAKIDEAKKYGQFSAAADRAIDLLKQGPTGSGFGSMVDSAAGFFGKSTQGADISSQLKTVSGWLTSNVPRMQGPQSDRDVINYQVMAGNVGNEKLPINQRLAAAQEVKRLQDKYADLRDSTPGQQASPTASATPMPPNPTAKDLSPGTVYDTPRGPAVWDGFQFKKVH